MEKYNCRNDVPEKYKWDLTSFFKDDKDYEQNYQKLQNLIPSLKNYKNCTKDSQKLYEFLELYVNTISLWEDLYVYAYLINDEELGISKNIERKNKIENLNNEISLNTSFFEPELMKLNKKDYDNLFKTNENLNTYKAYLDQIYRFKKHILNEEKENIVSSLTNAMNHFDDISSNLLNSEHDYGKIKKDNEEIEIATNNYRKLLKDKDENIRKEVYTKFNEKIDQYSQTSASLLNSYVSMNTTLAHIYKYKTSWDQKLFSLNLSNNVFKTLVNTVESRLGVLQKYYKLKKDVLNLDKLNAYDMSLELSSKSIKYSIEDALELIYEALKPLGEDYLKKFKKIIDNRYIDYCQYKKKCSGGYSFSTMNQDSRILMSFNYDLDSVSTIAHESGHNVHHQYLKENNLPIYRNQSSLVCEVASLTNECLLSSYLAKNGKTKEEKLSGIENILGVIISNLFGAVREGAMEQNMYDYVENGGILTKDYLDNLSYEYSKKYLGNAVEDNKYFKNGWVNRSHYYMHFYLYSYAICISVASFIASKILNGDKDILDKYIKFLKTGSSCEPKDVFKVLDINLEDKNVYNEAINYFDNLINQYYSIYNGR